MVQLQNIVVYYVYVLLIGSKIVYIGTTDNPERREREHRLDKKFDCMKTFKGAYITEYDAKKRERQELAIYRRTHNGKNPYYNKDSDG